MQQELPSSSSCHQAWQSVSPVSEKPEELRRELQRVEELRRRANQRPTMAVRAQILLRPPANSALEFPDV